MLFALLVSACQPADSKPQLTYPAARKGDVVDDYGGRKVPDPYRWMEALDSKDVADWVAASNAVGFSASRGSEWLFSAKQSLIFLDVRQKHHRGLRNG